MLPDRVSNPGPLAYESGALPMARAIEVLLYVHAGMRGEYNVL